MNALYELLGIELRGDAADVYRICGLMVLETEPHLIRHAIDQARKTIEPHGEGPYGADCSEIRAQLAQAEAVLTNPERKLALDEDIRAGFQRHSIEEKKATTKKAACEAPVASSRVPTARKPSLPRRAGRAGAARGERTKALLATVLLVAAVTLIGRQFGGPERFPKSRIRTARAALRPQALTRMRPPVKPSVPDLPLGIPQAVPGFEGVSPVYSPSLSPDLSMIVFSTRSRGTRRYDLAIADRGDVRKPFSNFRPVKGADSEADETCPALSSDSRELLFVQSDTNRKLLTRFVYARRDSTREDFQGFESIPIPGFDRQTVRLDTPQWVDKARGLLYMIVSLNTETRADRRYFFSKRTGRIPTVGEPARLPLKNPWPLTFLSANGLRAYQVTNRGILVASREATSAAFDPPCGDSLLTTEQLGPLDGPVWVSPTEDVLFYCSPGVGKELGHGRFLWMVRFR